MKDCIIWGGAMKHNGYGVLRRKGKTYRAHRYVYAKLHGAIPDGVFIMHTCDNPSCINPFHLKAGTPQENTTDMINKNRMCTGSAHPGSKLTEEDVLEIRKSVENNGTLSKRYNVSPTTITQIKKRERWNYLRK